MEPNQVDPFAFAVLRNLKQIDHTEETRLPRQLWSDVWKTDRVDRINFDFTFFHAIPGADPDMGTRPYADTASDLSAANSLAKTLREDHEKSLHPDREPGPLQSIAKDRAATLRGREWAHTGRGWRNRSPARKPPLEASCRPSAPTSLCPRPAWRRQSRSQ